MRSDSEVLIGIVSNIDKRSKYFFELTVLNLEVNVEIKALNDFSSI